jgi:hypothetical protein
VFTVLDKKDINPYIYTLFFLILYSIEKQKYQPIYRVFVLPICVNIFTFSIFAEIMSSCKKVLVEISDDSDSESGFYDKIIVSTARKKIAKVIYISRRIGLEELTEHLYLVMKIVQLLMQVSSVCNKITLETAFQGVEDSSRHF